jgi:hypothetical protein
MLTALRRQDDISALVTPTATLTGVPSIMPCLGNINRAPSVLSQMQMVYHPAQQVAHHANTAHSGTGCPAIFAPNQKQCNADIGYIHVVHDQFAL